MEEKRKLALPEAEKLCLFLIIFNASWKQNGLCQTSYKYSIEFSPTKSYDEINSTCKQALFNQTKRFSS